MSDIHVSWEMIVEADPVDEQPVPVELAPVPAMYHAASVVRAPAPVGRHAAGWTTARLIEDRAGFA